MKAGGQTSSGGKSGSGLAPNVASLLCYICGPIPITSIVFLLIEKENKDVRFHAWQDIFLSIAFFGLLIVLKVLEVVLGSIANFFAVLISILSPILWLGLFILLIVCLIKAYQGERWRVPVIGDMAAKKAGV